jgi:hypothetical protein
MERTSTLKRKTLREKTNSASMMSLSARERREQIQNNPEMIACRLESLTLRQTSNLQLKGVLDETLAELGRFLEGNRRLLDATLEVRQARKLKMKISPAVFASPRIPFQTKDLLRELVNSYTIFLI